MMKTLAHGEVNNTAVPSILSNVGVSPLSYAKSSWLRTVMVFIIYKWAMAAMAISNYQRATKMGFMDKPAI